MSHEVGVAVRFIAPPEDLRPYFTTFYLTEITTPTPDEPVRDALQPEWANLRFFDGAAPISWIDGGDRVEQATFVGTGPSSRSANFALASTRFWGIGLLPLGWARFVRQPAARHANLIADGAVHPSFARFVPLACSLFGKAPDPDAECARIIDFFRAFPPRPHQEEAQILALHEAMVDPATATVAQLVERVGATQRTVERIAARHFGFSPKILLRRQRFMRSLAHFMLDPSMKWIDALDSQYHDQAQFVRDFHDFMGMTPSEYAALPHPILSRFMHERARVHGAAVQTLDVPTGGTTPD